MVPMGWRVVLATPPIIAPGHRGWAPVHPLLEQCGGRYVETNSWSKSTSHIVAANTHGRPAGALDGCHPATSEQWACMRALVTGPHGVTNVWQHPALHTNERIKTSPNGRAVHANQPPLDLLDQIMAASGAAGDLGWEPLGGLFSAAWAAQRVQRRAVAAVIDPRCSAYGVARFIGY